MARCTDCIHYEACLKFADVRIVLCGDMADRRCKVFKHTADVVPRAELAREIFGEIAQIKKEYASGDIDGDTLYAMLHLLEKKYTEANHETRN